jgi:cytochrome c oxidase subunit 2
LRCIAGLLCGLAALSFLPGGCAGSPSMLDAQGPAAARIAGLTGLLFILGGAIYLAVVTLIAVALFRKRSNSFTDTPHPNEDEADRRPLIIGGLAFPAAVLVIVFGATLSTLTGVFIPNTSDELAIEVVGHQWWWEVRYPHQQVTTANEIHIPVGQPIEVKLEAIDVIHSLWVPQLHGKLDMIPGRTNTTWLQADRPGEYRGLCAEFCGIQHANMQFIVIAEPPEQFNAWLNAQRQPAAEPVDSNVQRGQQVFLSTPCAKCHAVRGTDAAGDLGPDLTHLASRRTLGAGIRENNRGNLAGWIIDPQNIKPGNLMPVSDLSGADLQALLAYLESLK